MSPILINSQTSSVVPPVVQNKKKLNESDVEAPVEDEVVVEKSREDRRATGRSIAIIIFLSLMCLTLYHVLQKKKSVLAGVLVPALILCTYLFFVIHVSTREKKRRKQLEEAAVSELEVSVQSEVMTKHAIHKKISTVSTPSLSSIQSASGTSMNSASRVAGSMPRQAMSKSSSFVRVEGQKSSKVLIDPKGVPTQSGKKVPPPFKKAQSQSHILVKANHSQAHVAVEHETKKLKKSRSFDKNNYLGEPRHMIDNKKIKTKH